MRMPEQLLRLTALVVVMLVFLASPGYCAGGHFDPSLKRAIRLQLQDAWGIPDSLLGKINVWTESVENNDPTLNDIRTLVIEIPLLTSYSNRDYFDRLNLNDNRMHIIYHYDYQARLDAFSLFLQANYLVFLREELYIKRKDYDIPEVVVFRVKNRLGSTLVYAFESNIRMHDPRPPYIMIDGSKIKNPNGSWARNGEKIESEFFRAAYQAIPLQVIEPPPAATESISSALKLSRQ